MNDSVRLRAESFARAGELLQRLKAAVALAFVGQANVVEEVLAAMLAGGHVLLEGVPGLGKTLLVQALSRAVGGNYSRIQFTPDIMPADVTGHTIYDPNTAQFMTRRGPVFANFLLADEINRAPAKTQAALLEVMQEGQVTLDGVAQKLDPPFMVLATQNPIEQEGTYALPEAQLDRFLLKVNIAYPSEAEELSILRSVTNNRSIERLPVERVQAVVQLENLIKLQTLTAYVRVDPEVEAYALRIVRATRSFAGIGAGASTRGAIALVRASRALALLQGRDFVTPDDLKKLAPAALRHRIMPVADLVIEGRSPDHLIAELLEKIAAPRL